ncbi:MAG: ribose 5-phosphate isomerase B [Clostridia bacterium]|nr:ribose 5-phosphate isomerase B [Clostridia bacterium]
MKIAFGSDHAGYRLKRTVMEHLAAAGHQCDDLGTDTEDTPASYVPAAVSVAAAVNSGAARFGVLVCGTGLGISISANKIDGIRAALCTNEYMARMSRQHNDANVLALGARVVGTGLACSIADAFLAEEFEAGGRHQVRVNEMMSLE